MRECRRGFMLLTDSASMFCVAFLKVTFVRRTIARGRVRGCYDCKWCVAGCCV